MAAETATANIASLINVEYISPLMAQYALDAFVTLDKVRVENLALRATKQASWPIPTKDTLISASTNEASDLSNTALDFTDATASVAEYGILRDVTKLAKRTSVLGGEDALTQWIIEEGGVMCFEAIENALVSRFTSASTSVGTSGGAFTLSNLASGQSKLAINKARGECVCVLSGQQQSDLRDALVTTTATAFSDAAVRGAMGPARQDGYFGRVLGCDVWYTNLAASATDDKVGICMINGAVRPEYAPIGLAVLWWPEAEQLNNPSLRSEEIAITTAFAQAEILDYCYVKFVTRGS